MITNVSFLILIKVMLNLTIIQNVNLFHYMSISVVRLHFVLVLLNFSVRSTSATGQTVTSESNCSDFLFLL